MAIESSIKTYDNACAESFFALLKRERIRRKIYRSREEDKADIFNYIELFYNPTRRHGIIMIYRQWSMKKLFFETRSCLIN